MKRQLSWIIRGSVRTQHAFDEQGAAIRGVQQQLAELQSAVARIDRDVARIDAAAGALVERLDDLRAKTDRIDGTVNELVRVVAPPSSD